MLTERLFDSQTEPSNPDPNWIPYNGLSTFLNVQKENNNPITEKNDVTSPETYNTDCVHPLTEKYTVQIRQHRYYLELKEAGMRTGDDIIKTNLGKDNVTELKAQGKAMRSQMTPESLKVPTIKRYTPLEMSIYDALEITTNEIVYIDATMRVPGEPNNLPLINDLIEKYKNSSITLIIQTNVDVLIQVPSMTLALFNTIKREGLTVKWDFEIEATQMAYAEA